MQASFVQWSSLLWIYSYVELECEFRWLQADTLYLSTSWNQGCIILKDTATCKENWPTLVVCDATSDEHTVTSAHWVGGSHTTRLVVELGCSWTQSSAPSPGGGDLSWLQCSLPPWWWPWLTQASVDPHWQATAWPSGQWSCSQQSLDPHSSFSLPTVHCCIYTRSIVAASFCLNIDCLRESCDLCTCAHSGSDGYVTTEVRFGFHRVFLTDFSLRGSPYRSSERFLVTFLAC